MQPSPAGGSLSCIPGPFCCVPKSLGCGPAARPLACGLLLQVKTIVIPDPCWSLPGLLIRQQQSVLKLCSHHHMAWTESGSTPGWGMLMLRQHETDSCRRNARAQVASLNLPVAAGPMPPALSAAAALDEGPSPATPTLGAQGWAHQLHPAGATWIGLRPSYSPVEPPPAEHVPA